MEQTNIDLAAMRLTNTIFGNCEHALEETLEAIADDIGLKNIAYVRFVSHSDRRMVDMAVTYSMHWQERYSENQYLSIDPIIAYGCEAILPFDWDELKTTDPTSDRFFADAMDHDVGRNGMSIPVRNRAGGFALVSFTSDHTREDWTEFKKLNMTKLLLMATLIDSAASFTRKTPAFTENLSVIERECLIWFARGENDYNIAEGLGLSISDVTLYLDTARHKLNCISLTQAVAVAIATEIIPQNSHR